MLKKDEQHFVCCHVSHPFLCMILLLLSFVRPPHNFCCSIPSVHCPHFPLRGTFSLGGTSADLAPLPAMCGVKSSPWGAPCLFMIISAGIYVRSKGQGWAGEKIRVENEEKAGVVAGGGGRGDGAREWRNGPAEIKQEGP